MLAETDDLIDALSPVVAAFNDLKIPHYVGGSIASSYHGATRSTMDVDLVCEMLEAQIPEFLARIDDRFYVSELAVRQAEKSKSCFNLIHLPTSFKVDIFVSRERHFDIDCMRRASVATLGDSKTVEVPIATAEDGVNGVLFVGDFVDRGPAIGEVIEIVRSMVDANDALAVVGNHEYNAIAFHTPVPGKQDAWFRAHSDKNLKQHDETLKQLSSKQLTEAIEWFKSLPVALEVDGVRVAHASWQTRNIECINEALKAVGRFTPEFFDNGRRSR